MRTWKWMFTASLLISLSAMAQQTTDQSPSSDPVQNAADVQKALSAVPAGQDVLVLVWSNGGTTFRVLHANAANEDKPGM